MNEVFKWTRIKEGSGESFLLVFWGRWSFGFDGCVQLYFKKRRFINRNRQAAADWLSPIHLPCRAYSTVHRVQKIQYCMLGRLRQYRRDIMTDGTARRGPECRVV
ncbi:MAG: hypothetical protein P1V20_32595 [Verrucomicrobiales bacterium]|nr:hypothetical protein [Verrucomicrobiales bacterium]